MGHHSGSFPFATYLSLEGVIRYWWEQSRNPSSPLADQAKLLLERVDATPELRGRIADLAVIEKHRELVDGLMTALFPVADDDAYGATGEPLASSTSTRRPRRSRRASSRKRRSPRAWSSTTP